MLDELRAKSREERMEYFMAHKSELMSFDLEEVSGGAAAGKKKKDEKYQSNNP